jgi:hypothetical protein
MGPLSPRPVPVGAEKKSEAPAGLLPRSAFPINGGSVPLKVLTQSDQRFLWRQPFGDGLIETWRSIVALGPEAAADLGRVDRYFLLTQLLHRVDAWHPWLFDRTREVEQDADGHLDLWAREHYKSTIITFAGSISEILRDPEITIGIFSHTKPNAKKFVLQIMQELEDNKHLLQLYPDVLWANPRREAPEWSEEKGITVRRKSNPRESTLEGHGLVDGQPVGAHFRLRVYDDVVTLESVTTPEQVKKTTEALAVSDNLGARGEDGKKREQFVGTRYKFSDTYQDMIDRKQVKVRLYPGTADGTPTGKPVFLTQEAMNELRRKQPTAIFAAQILQNPTAGSEAMFRKEWVRFSDIRPSTLNVYIMCDPASSRKKGSDRTAMYAVGMDAARNKYLLSGYHHKMGLAERWQKLSGLWKFWVSMPGVQIVKVGYERYGLLDAMEHFEERQLIEGLGFEILELAWPAEGGNAKYDRIQRLEPDFRAGKWWFAGSYEPELPGGADTRNQRMVREAGQAYRIFEPTRNKDAEGNVYSLNKQLFDEYVVYPYSAKDDGLDCLSRIYDMDPAPPVILEREALAVEDFVDGA